MISAYGKGSRGIDGYSHVRCLFVCLFFDKSIHCFYYISRAVVIQVLQSPTPTVTCFASELAKLSG